LEGAHFLTRLRSGVLSTGNSPFTPAEMKYPHGWRERKEPRGSVHYAALLDADDNYAAWISCSDANASTARQAERAMCRLCIALAQLVPIPDDLLALAYRNRPLSDEAWQRMAFALRLALTSLEGLRRG